MKLTNKNTSKQCSITIGIPAYNEEANIAALLNNILNQKLRNFVLEKIIVISDASDDGTVAIAKTISDSRLSVIVGRKRQGQALRQNQLFKYATSDIVVLLNADIMPTSPQFLEILCRPLLSNDHVGLVGAKVVPLSLDNSLVGKVLDWHHLWKNDLFEKINSGDNVYLCHGRARAFSKKLYRKLRWPSMASEDAYSYMQAKRLGFDFAFAPKACVWYTSPQTLADHIRQSARFLQSKQSKTSQDKKAENWYHIPKQLLLLSAIKAGLTHPLYAAAYALMMAATVGVCLLSRNKTQQHLWSMSQSTKTFSYTK
jgi:glycosyltransferase involved in cell wall biosynthesis